MAAGTSEEGRAERDAPPEDRCIDAHEIKSRIRFSLSDESGKLRFKRFDVDGIEECRGPAADVGAYLLGHPLVDLNVPEIQHTFQPGNSRSPCSRQLVVAVADTVLDLQRTFLGVLPPHVAAASRGRQSRKRREDVGD